MFGRCFGRCRFQVEGREWVSGFKFQVEGFRLKVSGFRFQVVRKDVEPWTVVGGNPAKVLKKRCLGV